MTYSILSGITASITELKTNPMQTVESAAGESIAILNRNKPAFYCVPVEMYERMIEALDDMNLIEIIHKRRGQKEIAVSINDL
jgi:antitoxin StbD